MTFDPVADARPLHRAVASTAIALAITAVLIVSIGLPAEAQTGAAAGPVTAVVAGHDDPIGIAAAPDGAWTVDASGTVVAHGGAEHHGDVSDIDLWEPIVGMAATPSGGGYWLVASDGGVFTYGDAAFHGSAGAIDLWEPIVGLAATPSGGGYWLVASDGGVFTYGRAGFHGSSADSDPASPVVGLVPTRRGAGYWVARADLTIDAFGAAPEVELAVTGSPGIMAVAAGPRGGLHLAFVGADGDVIIDQTGEQIDEVDPEFEPGDSPLPPTPEAVELVASLDDDRLALWDALAGCESGGDWAIDTGNGYYGGLQFAQGSWEGVGGTGLPHHHHRIEQIYRGELLLDVQGWGAWPSCTSELGLR